MVTGDPERGIGEMVTTQLTDTPPVEEGGSQSRVIIEELSWFWAEEDTLGFSGGEGESGMSVLIKLTVHVYMHAYVCTPSATHQPQ